MSTEHFIIADMLRRLPLFVGMDDAEMQQILAHTKFLFKKVRAERTALHSGERSGSLWMLAGGTVEISTPAADNSYHIVETLHAPTTIQTELIFGMAQSFQSTVTAVTTCNFIILDKTEIIRLTAESLIFRLNLLNILSNLQQKARQRLFRPAPRSMDNAIVRFILDRCVYPAGHKHLHITMKRLSEEMGVKRLTVSQALHRLQDRQLITLKRNAIIVPAAEHLHAHL